MILNILSSSSSGNCYILHSDTEAIIIEAGIRLSTIKKALDYNISKVNGVIATHSHGDHSGYIKECADAGMEVYCISDVIKRRELENHSRAHMIKPMQGFCVGRFSVFPFPVEHDIPCVGFHINHPETGNILFITDTFTCEYSFQDLNHILIEANYSEEMLQKNIERGEVKKSMRKRLMYSHMELQTTKQYLKAVDLSKVINIVLIHLSNQNSDEDRFIQEIRELTGKATYAADKNMQLQINNNQPF